MRILITTTLNKNMTEAKIKPLLMLSEVEQIFYVSDMPGPYFEKVRYYCTPGWILKFCRNNSLARWAYKFFTAGYLALSKRPDMIMGYALIPHGINAVLIGKLLNIPVCVNFMGGNFLIESINPLLRKLILRIADMADIITVTGSHTRDLLVSKGIKADKIRIISSTIDTKRFFPQHLNKKYDIIAVAQLNHGKRISMFLDIISRIKKSGFNLKVVIAGDGCLKKDLEELSEKMGLLENVYFAGFQPDIEKFLNESKVFLLPTAHEGLSLAMLEAMACGVVPVVSNVDNLSDAVKDRFSGRLIDRDDTEGFVSAVSELLKDKNIYETYAKNSVKIINEFYTINNAAQKWTEALSGLGKDRNVFRWYFKRLMAMSGQEVIYRAIGILRKKILYFKVISLGKEIFSSSVNNIKPVFFIDKQDLDFIRDNIKRSGSVVPPHPSLSPTGERGVTFSDDIKRRAGFSDFEIRAIWEPNRFQWLVSYAQAYALDRDEKIAKDIVCVLNDWILKNPFMKTLNWIDSLEVSLRLLSWSWIYFLIKDSKSMDTDFKKVFLKSIYMHAEFIKNNLSRYSSANNHLIGEATGLFVAGILFPGFRASSAWTKKGKLILEREMMKQVYPDGVNKEQSSHYHEFVMDLYLVAVVLAKKNNIVFSEKMLLRLNRMGEFLISIMDQKCETLSIGDSDDGVALKFGASEETQNAISLMNTACILFNRPDFKIRGDYLDEKSLWLMGYEGYIKYSAMGKADSKQDSKCFPESGYYIMRNRELCISFDCGGLGYLSLSSHGHADSLSINLNVRESPVFIDPGTYLYHSRGKWRDYFRGTSAHNTIKIDKLDQSEIEGPFLWGYKARSFLKYWSPNRRIDKVCGYHTGYTRLSDPVSHARDITFDKCNNEIVILDSIFSKKRHLVEQFFHLHPDCSLDRINKYELKIINGNSVLNMEIDHSLDMDIITGSENPILGWYSSGFGEKRKTMTIRNKAYIQGNKNFITKIRMTSHIMPDAGKAI